MSILIVDDSELSRSFLADLLDDAGYEQVACASSAEEAFAFLGLDGPQDQCRDIDLILLDINLPHKNGIQACRELKQHTVFAEVPVIIVSGVEHFEGLEAAFDAGAMDYITKPPHRVELLARVRSALQLKREMDERKIREAELLVLNERLASLNRELERMTITDSLTGLANRRCFNEFIVREWRRAARDSSPCAILMIDIDHFKNYNDTAGHLAGDICLQKIAMALQAAVKRPGDLLARYGGEEFVIVLPETDRAGATTLAEECHHQITRLKLSHPASPVAEHVTISIGVAVVTKDHDMDSAQVIACADEMLYRAKESGRNCTQVISL